MRQGVQAAEAGVRQPATSTGGPGTWMQRTRAALPAPPACCWQRACALVGGAHGGLYVVQA
eukprot:scaffold138913_cov18-Tisochrysis_lutea.AAC.1